MNPSKVERQNIESLTDLPNIGKAMAADLQLIGVHKPDQLKGMSAYDMYNKLCKASGHKHDPCVIDVFLSITDFVEGGDAKPWWIYTAERKKHLSKL